MSRVEVNLVVNNGNVFGDESDLFFGGESISFISPNVDMWEILVRTSIFPSRSQARKNWKHSGEKIPDGFSDFEHIGKLHHRITILNPTIENLLY